MTNARNDAFKRHMLPDSVEVIPEKKSRTEAPSSETRSEVIVLLNEQQVRKKLIHLFFKYFFQAHQIDDVSVDVHLLAVMMGKKAYYNPNDGSQFYVLEMNSVINNWMCALVESTVEIDTINLAWVNNKLIREKIQKSILSPTLIRIEDYLILFLHLLDKSENEIAVAEQIWIRCKLAEYVKELSIDEQLAILWNISNSTISTDFLKKYINSLDVALIKAARRINISSMNVRILILERETELQINEGSQSISLIFDDDVEQYFDPFHDVTLSSLWFDSQNHVTERLLIKLQSQSQLKIGMTYLYLNMISYFFERTLETANQFDIDLIWESNYSLRKYLSGLFIVIDDVRYQMNVQHILTWFEIALQGKNKKVYQSIFNAHILALRAGIQKMSEAEQHRLLNLICSVDLKADGNIEDSFIGHYIRNIYVGGSAVLNSYIDSISQNNYLRFKLEIILKSYQATAQASRSVSDRRQVVSTEQQILEEVMVILASKSTLKINELLQSVLKINNNQNRYQDNVDVPENKESEDGASDEMSANRSVKLLKEFVSILVGLESGTHNVSDIEALWRKNEKELKRSIRQLPVVEQVRLLNKVLTFDERFKDLNHDRTGALNFIHDYLFCVDKMNLNVFKNCFVLSIQIECPFINFKRRMIKRRLELLDYSKSFIGDFLNINAIRLDLLKEKVKNSSDAVCREYWLSQHQKFSIAINKIKKNEQVSFLHSILQIMFERDSERDIARLWIHQYFRDTYEPEQLFTILSTYKTYLLLSSDDYGIYQAIENYETMLRNAHDQNNSEVKYASNGHAAASNSSSEVSTCSDHHTNIVLSGGLPIPVDEIAFYRSQDVASSAASEGLRRFGIVCASVPPLQTTNPLAAEYSMDGQVGHSFSSQTN